MKTPAEWIEIYINTPNYGIGLMIEQIQKEAYEEAVDDAVELAKSVYKNKKIVLEIEK